MIQRVYENAVKAKTLERVIVATDDERSADCVKGFGGECVMTGMDIKTGTERVAQAIEGIEADIILNIQGDEPLVPPELLDELVTTLIGNEDIPVCTPVTRIRSFQDLTDPNQARVIFDKTGKALCFTRAVVPHIRDVASDRVWLDHGEYWKHIGIYCFRRDFLSTFVKLPPGRLERLESLEQLRILENGYPIQVVKTDYSPVCVDIPEDIEKVETLL